jgi:hypothetical protein
LSSSQSSGAVTVANASTRPAPDVSSKPVVRMSTALSIIVWRTWAGVRQEFLERSSAATAAECGAAAEVPKNGSKQTLPDGQIEVATPSKAVRSGLGGSAPTGRRCRRARAS